MFNYTTISLILCAGMSLSAMAFSQEKKAWNWQETPKYDHHADFPADKKAWKAPKDDEKRKKLLSEIKFFRDKIINGPEEIKALPSAEDFPGIPADGTPIITKTIKIDPEKGGWHSTGLYALPGTMMTITMDEDTKFYQEPEEEIKEKNASSKKDKEKAKPKPKKNKSLNYSIVVGCHKDKLNATKHTTWKRTPELSYSAPIAGPITKMTSPSGGLVYINVNKAIPNAKPLEIKISQVVESPRFILGKTSPEQWKQQLNTTVPWGEIETPRVIVSLPLDQLKSVPDMESMAKHLQKNMQLHDWLAGWDKTPEKMNHPMRFVVDRQISAGAGHSGYPAMGTIGWGKPIANGDLITKGSWGLWHELGHNHQQAPFRLDNMGEVTVNLFSLLSQIKGCNMKPEESWGGLKNLEKEKKEFFSCDTPFNDYPKALGLKLGFFADIILNFGFDPFRFAAVKYQENPYPKDLSNPERWDWLMIALSEGAKKNFGPYFKAWKTPVSDKEIEKIKKLPVWLPTPDFPKQYIVTESSPSEEKPAAEATPQKKDETQAKKKAPTAKA